MEQDGNGGADERSVVRADGQLEEEVARLKHRVKFILHDLGEDTVRVL